MELDKKDPLLGSPLLASSRRRLDPEVCGLVKNFIARQGIIFAAGLVFLGYTAARVRFGYEKRNLKTFCADCSKQAGQQMVGGAMMVGLGLLLSESGFSPLAWYGAEYPFEIVMTTIFTGLFRKWAERGAVWLGRKTRWRWLHPFKLVGQYGPKENDFRCRWYWAQLVQAVFLIGLPARVCALLIIYASLQLLPDAASPVHAVASGWFHSGLTCEQQTAFILYVIPLTGNAPGGKSGAPRGTAWRPVGHAGRRPQSVPRRARPRAVAGGEEAPPGQTAGQHRSSLALPRRRRRAVHHHRQAAGVRLPGPREYGARL